MNVHCAFEILLKACLLQCLRIPLNARISFYFVWINHLDVFVYYIACFASDALNVWEFACDAHLARWRCVDYICIGCLASCHHHQQTATCQAPYYSSLQRTRFHFGSPSGIIRSNWYDPKKISMAPSSVTKCWNWSRPKS